jgi:uncharacterized membrane-anchored protein YitT (DUF2179 family)
VKYRLPLLSVRRNMALTNQPKDDAKAMTDEYVKGVTIADIAAKYNHTEQEVTTVVTKDVDTEQQTTQLSQDSVTTPKKDK